MKANYSSCVWFTLAHAGWTPRVAGRQGDNALIRFTSPEGHAEERLVPVDRLGKGLRDALEYNFPKVFRRPVLRVAFR